MKLSSFLHFAGFGIKTVLFRKKEPILGTVIVTDKCNLKCKHCSVNNITAVVHPYEQIRREMQQLYDMGIRILFFCGGETFLWRDGERTLRDLVVEAKEMGFLIVNVVTNGTFPIDLPEADLILLSLDGDRERHNAVRGDTYDTIMENIKHATSDNICFYMAINQINKDAVEHVCLTARDTKNVRAVSFNFHTPYPDTRELALSREEKTHCCDVITRMMKAGAPVFNLRSAFPYLINNSFPTPCHQCVVIENGKVSTCGRCIDVPNLCDECGYFFVAEYTLLFKGNPKITAVSALSERLYPSPFELWMHMPVGLVIRAAKAGHNLRAAVFHTGVLIGAGQHVEAHFLLLCSYPISPKTAVLSKGAFCHFGKEPRHQLIQTRYLHCPSDF